jgi:hypothetical protein
MCFGTDMPNTADRQLMRFEQNIKFVRDGWDGMETYHSTSIKNRACKLPT